MKNFDVVALESVVSLLCSSERFRDALLCLWEWVDHCKKSFHQTVLSLSLKWTNQGETPEVWTNTGSWALLCLTAFFPLAGSFSDAQEFCRDLRAPCMSPQKALGSLRLLLEEIIISPLKWCWEQPLNPFIHMQSLDHWGVYPDPAWEWEIGTCWWQKAQLLDLLYKLYFVCHRCIILPHTFGIIYSLLGISASFLMWNLLPRLLNKTSSSG